MKTESLHKIESAVKQVSGYGIEQMAAADRSLPPTLARMLFCHEARKMGFTYCEIGHAIGRHHSTVMYFVRRYQDEIATSGRFREMAADIIKLIRYPPLPFQQ